MQKERGIRHGRPEISHDRPDACMRTTMGTIKVNPHEPLVNNGLELGDIGRCKQGRGNVGAVAVRRNSRVQVPTQAVRVVGKGIGWEYATWDIIEWAHVHRVVFEWPREDAAAPGAFGQGWVSLRMFVVFSITRERSRASIKVRAVSEIVRVRRPVPVAISAFRQQAGIKRHLCIATAGRKTYG
ncbi:hypothetical protein GB937_007909 [Aspergillus fischeri]|nr:hypothetical protein GB937_007909 [Aspergillus fischeri]